MLRLEQLSFAGTHYRAKYENLYKQVELWLKEVKEFRDPALLTKAHSFPLAAERIRAEGEEVDFSLSQAIEAWNKLVNDEQPLGLADQRTQWQTLATAELMVESRLIAMLQDHSPAIVDSHDFRDLTAGAISCRLAAERATCPADLRVQYWNRRRVDQADRALRLGEDQLFLRGDAPTTLKERAPTAEANAVYRQVIDDNERLGDAFRMRDKQLRLLFWRGKWLRYRQLHGNSDLDSIQTSPTELLAEADAFNAMLIDRAELSAIEPAMAKLSHGKSVDDDYLATCQRVVGSNGDDVDTLRELIDLLEFPLASASMRERLWGQYFLGMERNLKGQELFKTSIKSRTAPREPIVNPAADARHPAVILARIADKSMSTDQDLAPIDGELLAELGGQIRTHLRELTEKSAANSIDSMHKQTFDLLNSSEPQPLEVIRLGDERADLAIREHADWATDHLASWLSMQNGNLPTALLRRIDRSYQLQWQMHRALADFWGPVAQSQSPRARNPFFFESVANAYNSEARRMLNGSQYAEKQHSANGTEISRQIEIADRGVQVSASSITCLRDASELQTLATELPQTVKAEGEGFPAGFAAITSLVAGKPIRSKTEGKVVYRHALKVGMTPFMQSIDRIVTTSDLGNASSIEVDCFFRGHRWPVEAEIQRIDVTPATSVNQYAAATGPSVTVHHRSRRAVHVMFVLDCSWSMHHMYDLGDGIEVTRLQLAANRLIQFLNGFVGSARDATDTRPYYFGLTLFGHRYGWPKEEFDVKKPQRHPTRFGANGVENVDKDVEVIIKTQRPFDESMFAEFKSLTADLDPWGTTPLYYSVSTAAQQFLKDNALNDVERRIVVITDGIDVHFGNEPEDEHTTMKKVLGQLKSVKEFDGIRVDVLAFPLTVDEKEDSNKATKRKEKREELKSLCTATEGMFLDIESGEELASGLQELFKGYRVRVTDNATTPRTIRLGETWKAGDPNNRDIGKSRPVTVEVIDANNETVAQRVMAMHGTEAIQLKFNPSSDRLELIGFDPDAFATNHGINVLRTLSLRGTETTNDPDRLKATLFGSADEAGHVLYLALENANKSEFTPQPTNVCAIVRSDGDDAKTVIVAANAIQNATPVPIYRFELEDVHANSNERQMTLLVSYSNTEPVYDGKVRQTDNGQAGLALSGLDDVVILSEERHRPNEYQLVITELYENNDIHRLLLDVTPRPSSSRHAYKQILNQVQHAYTYPKHREVNVRIWRIEELRQVAMSLENSDSRSFLVTLP